MCFHSPAYNCEVFSAADAHVTRQHLIRKLSGWHFTAQRYISFRPSWLPQEQKTAGPFVSLDFCVLFKLWCFHVKCSQTVPSPSHSSERNLLHSTHNLQSPSRSKTNHVPLDTCKVHIPSPQRVRKQGHLL